MSSIRTLAGPETMNAPWRLESRRRIVELANDFFDIDPGRNTWYHLFIGKQPPPPGSPRIYALTVEDFHRYLEQINAFEKTPNVFEIARIAQQMESAGLLIRVGRGGDSGTPALGDQYLRAPTSQDRAPFSWVSVLGPEYLYRISEPGLAHITGTKAGNVVAGSGLVVDAYHVLTCRHVVSDMEVNQKQRFQGQEYETPTESIRRHSDVDVALVRVDGPPLTTLRRGAFWRTPAVAQTVYTLGYPKLPGLRDASVTMQQGMVTNEAVTALSGESLFLYSAISRPGNSGGPIMSNDGYIVGLSTVAPEGQYERDEAFSPHYAGIPAQVVVEAVRDLRSGLELSFESYE